MHTLVQNQREYFNTNLTKPVTFRIEQLKRLRSLLITHQTALYDAIYSDYKKSSFDCFLTELIVLNSDLNLAIKKVNAWARKRRVRTNLLNWPAQSDILPEPLGVTLVIGAWNYPIQLSLAPAVAALAAGNTVILKPSELCPATSRVMAKMINENFDPRYFKVIEGGVPETTALLAEKFDKIFFTGSTTVGKVVYAAAAKNLTPVTLELGGKSPAIVAADCDLAVSAKRLIWAKFLNAGQTCIAPDYVLVHESVEKTFLEKAKREIDAAGLTFANGNYVQIINEKNATRLVDLIDKTKLYAGGEHNIKERYIGPTLLTNVSFTDKVMEEEIFGPILPIIRYSNLDTIIAEIKSRPKPLSLYLFTRSKDVESKVLGELSFGGGCINDAVMHISNGNLPFGGVGESGLGRYHGEAGFGAFSHYKSVLRKPYWLETSLKYSPHTPLKLKLLKWISG